MKSLLEWLRRIESTIAALAYTVVAGLLLGEIVARELFSDSIWGSQKIAVFAAIIAGFLGLSLATGANSHLRPQFADGWWPDDWQPAIARLGDLLSAVLFTGFGIIATIYVTETFANNDKAAVLYWPLWPIQIVLPYAFLSSAFRHLIFALRPDLKPTAELVG